MPIARTVAWPALLAGAVGCVVVSIVAGLVRPSAELGQWPGLGALMLCAGAAFVLDDSASAMTGAAPTPLARRRLLRIALALPLLATVWAGTLWYMTSAGGAVFTPDTRAALTVQVASMLALTLAASAVALRVMPDEHGGWLGVLAPVAVVGTALTLPAGSTLLALPGDAAWHVAQQRWAALLAVALVVLAWATREPPGRLRRRRSTYAS